MRIRKTLRMEKDDTCRFAARKKEWLRQYKEDQMRKLDAQGRHRSEWCYAPYDGRCV